MALHGKVPACLKIAYTALIWTFMDSFIYLRHVETKFIRSITQFPVPLGSTE